MPVLPLVGSTIVAPGLSDASRSASSIIASAIRSFTLPPGLSDSSLASTLRGCAAACSASSIRRKSGTQRRAARDEVPAHEHSLPRSSTAVSCSDAPSYAGSHGSPGLPEHRGDWGPSRGPTPSDVIHRPSGSASRRRPDHQVFQRPAIHHAGHRVGDLLPELAQVVRVGAVVPSQGRPRTGRSPLRRPAGRAPTVISSGALADMVAAARAAAWRSAARRA